ncbi:MAG: extracellular solute-binding protein [Bacillota bacterium]|nr:extracellular solute-binding protein [Bacillota bacterium]
MKRLTSLLLCALLLLSALSAAAEPVITEPQLPLTETPVTYTAMVVQHALDTGDASTKSLYLEREKETNVKFDWTVVPSTSKAERIATTFASGDLPDVFVNTLDNSQVLTYGMAGALLPVSDYLEHMPNFSAILEAMPAVKTAVTMPDGKIYGLPQVNMYSVWPGNGVYVKTTAFINKTWLDKLGLEMPTTTEELQAVLTAFKEKDPNGNGQADEIPLSFVYKGWAETPSALLYAPFGIIGMASQLNVQEGKAFYAIQDERYIQAAKYIRGLWDAGLIDPEAYTQDAKRYYAKGLEETPVYGVFIDWTGSSTVGNARILGEDNELGTGDEEYVPLPPLKGPDGTVLWENQAAGINTNRLCIASTVENPELLLKWADYLYTPDNSIQEIWGQFGTHTRKNEDGSWTRIAPPEGVNGDEWLLQTTTRGLPGLLTDQMVEKFDTIYPNGNTGSKRTDLKYRLSSIYAPFAVKEFYPSVVLSSEANERIAVLMTPLRNAMVEQEVAWLTGQGDIEAEYPAFIEQLKSLGIEEVVKIYQDAKDAVQ